MGERIGRYQLLRQLAAGGMGEVFLARADGPAGFSKTVVVKRILRHLVAQPTFVEMFLNEARVAALLSHPNVVQIFELGHEEGTYFIVMEYVHGMSLQAIQKKLLARGERLAPHLAVFLCAQALRGLSHAHTLHASSGEPMGIIHRDVTPDNLLVGFDGVVKVVDFGIAKAAISIPTTATGTVKGKFAYMAPEQIRGQHVDARLDLFALGVVLYGLLAGRPPFEGGSEAAVLHSVLHNAPPPLPSLNPAVTPELAAIVEKALAKDPDQRFSSAEAMAAALETILDAQPKRVGLSTLASFLKTELPEEAQKPSPTGEFATVPRETPPVPVGKRQTGEERPTAVLRTPTAAARPAGFFTTDGIPVDLDLDPSPRRGRLGWALGVAVGVLLVTGWAWRVLREDAPPGSGLTAAAPSAAVLAPAVPVEPLPAASPPRSDPVVVASTDPSPAEPGTVELRVNPWADVYLRGKKVGTTPMRALSLPSGTHAFTLKNPELGVERRFKITVLAGKRVTLKADLFE